MSRSKWKGAFLVKKFLNLKQSIKNNSKIWSRSSSIPKSLVGKTLLVHNGKTFKRVIISRERVGFKLGSFSSTRMYTSKYNKNLIKPKRIKK